ncbi:ferric-chelate reductase-like protein [Pseudohyphozyma bogoriensis]|nr:ferric-chelate reductase-like protein [Pseudohyphozyma bogoriensis]
MAVKSASTLQGLASETGSGGEDSAAFKIPRVITIAIAGLFALSATASSAVTMMIMFWAVKNAKKFKFWMNFFGVYYIVEMVLWLVGWGLNYRSATTEVTSACATLDSTSQTCVDKYNSYSWLFLGVRAKVE